MGIPSLSPEKGFAAVPGTKTIFYGWWIVGAALAVNIVCSGIGFYAHGVLMDPLREQYGWPKGLVSSAFTFYFIASGVVGLRIGRILDLYGPRMVVTIGSLIFGVSLILLGFVREIWQLFAVYFILSVGFTATSMLPINTLISNWFIRKRGLAMSITMSGLSIGGMIMVPLANWLIANWGLKTAVFVLGLLYVAVCVPIALFIFKGSPAAIGQYPDGCPPSNQSALDTTAGEKKLMENRLQAQRWTRLQAMRTATFWTMTGAFFFALTGQVAFLVHQMSFLSMTMGRAGAATAISLTAAASILGRLTLGGVVDRLDQRLVTVVTLFLQSMAVIAMAFSSNVAILYGGTFMFGLSMGTLLMMQALVTANCFGSASFGTVFALSNLFVICGSAIGPAIAGFIFDATESYRLAFVLFAAMNIIAVILIIFTRLRKISER